MIQSTKEFFDEIDSYFQAQSAHIDVFVQQRTRKEGWFQGELCHLLAKWRVPEWNCEIPLKMVMPEADYLKYLAKGGKENEHIDFGVTIGREQIYLEMKALYVDLKEDRTPLRPSYRSLSYYWPQVKKDIRKLAVCNQGQSYCMVFMYPSPKPHLIESFIEEMRKAGSTLVPVSDSDPLRDN